MRDNNAELEQKGLVVLGISFDSVEANRAFAEKFAFPYRLLCDTSRRVGLAYGAATTPDQECAKRISYVIDEDGMIEFAYDKVNAAAHLNEVKRALGW